MDHDRFAALRLVRFGLPISLALWAGIFWLLFR